MNWTKTKGSEKTVKQLFMKAITVLKNSIFSIEAVSTRLDKQSKNKLFQQTIKDGDFMSTCPIFARQINFKTINCRKTIGKTINQATKALIE